MKYRRRVLMALDWYDDAIHTGIAEFARTEGWILNTHMSRTRQFPKGWVGDGVIALVDYASAARHIRSLNIPVVDMGGHFTEFTQVLSDNYQIGSLAAEYLLEKRHKNFYFLHVQSSRLEQEISTGFNTTLKGAGFSCQMNYWKQTREQHIIDYQEVQKWAVSVLQKAAKPAAVMCQNDDTAVIILNACVDAGIRIPEEVAILGAGNHKLFCEFQTKTLSSVDPDLRLLGYESAKELSRLMSGGVARRSVLRVPPKKEIVNRESTDFLAVSNPYVLLVLRYLWDHFREPLSVEKLAKLVPISRSAIYALFTQEVGLPMAKELMRVRLEEVKRLLRTTHQPIGKVARCCGFSSLITFSRAFTQRTGVTARDYRKKMCS